MDVKVNKNDIKFEKLSQEYISDILKLQNSNTDPSLFCRFTEKELIEDFKNDIILGAFYDDCLIGVSVILLPQENEKSLYSDINENYKNVVTFDGVIIKKEFRGLGLQRQFIQLAKDIAKKRNIEYIGATVSPLNSFSKDNFLKMGFSPYCEKLKYGGQKRIILKCKI